MKRKLCSLLLFLVLAVRASGADSPTPSPDAPPLVATIVIPLPNPASGKPPANTNTIVIDSDQSHFDVVLKNISNVTLNWTATPLRGLMGGWVSPLGVVSVTLLDETGKIWHATPPPPPPSPPAGNYAGPKPQPAPTELKPNESITLRVSLADLRSWNGFPDLPLEIPKTFTVQATVSIGSNTAEGWSWQGNVTTAPRKITFTNKLPK